MDRTDEFTRIVKIFAPQTGAACAEDVPPRPPHAPSLFSTMAMRVAASLDANEALVARLSVLADRKEFSNDPTEAMAELSQQFQEGVSSVQQDLGRMKGLEDTAVSERLTGVALHQQQHQQQHHKLLSQGLHKRLAGQVADFQAAVRTHTLHVQARNKRVDRYGAAAKTAHATMASAAAAAGGASSSSSSSSAAFAMFQAPRGALALVPQQASPLKSQAPLPAAAAPAVAPALHVSTNRDGVPPAPGTASALRRSASSASSSAEGTELRKRAGGLGSGDRTLAATPTPGACAPIPAPPPLYGGNAYTQRRQAGPSGTSHSAAGSFDAYGAGGHLHGDDDSQAKGGHSKLQQRAPGGYNMARLRGAEKVEAAIAQMGGLFTQMAGLVLEQGETLQRIEDDVEAGLDQTLQAHAEMQYFYELSKGNRGLIIKLLLLLVFFAFLFLKWF